MCIHTFRFDSTCTKETGRYVLISKESMRVTGIIEGNSKIKVSPTITVMFVNILQQSSHTLFQSRSSSCWLTVHRNAFVGLCWVVCGLGATETGVESAFQTSKLTNDNSALYYNYYLYHSHCRLNTRENPCTICMLTPNPKLVYNLDPSAPLAFEGMNGFSSRLLKIKL